LQLNSGEKSRIADKINEHRQLRRAKHPDYKVLGCAGSVFKNIKEPELIPAGKLLEEAGARGLKIGGAEVFHKHCNIIVNAGKATASDVKQLAIMMRQKVKAKFDIKLDYEVMTINYK
jgi:UDP-N-acetylmuramate dehydrogenase